MNVEDWAALGSRRGAGESLASWLRASPVNVHVFGTPLANGQGAGSLYCPACRVDEAGRRRWYTREDWPLDAVMCTTHALPLLRCDTPPARLRSRRWSRALRDEFRALGTWSQQARSHVAGYAITRVVCARSDPRLPHSRAWAEAQWHLWASGWPVPASPRFPRRGPLTPAFQFDRLALAAIVRRVYVACDTGQETGWPALPVRARVLAWLQGWTERVHPHWRQCQARCFRDATGHRSRP